MDKYGIYISFLLYLGGMLGIGFYFYNQSKNFSHYVLADRNLNYWVTSLSAQASDMSGWLLLGLPGFAFLNGAQAVWIAIGLALGTYLNWHLVAKRLRVYSQKVGDSLTIPAFLSNRFLDRSNILRALTSFFILVFFLIYTASGFVAGSKLFTGLLGVEYVSALWISALVIVGYTFLGGFSAVSWTDFIQGMIMFLAVVVVPIVTIAKHGGLSESISFFEETNSELLNPFTQASGENLSFLAILSLLGWGFGYFGQPHILARFMAIKNPGEIVKAKKMAMTWVGISLACAVLIGLSGYVWYQGSLLDSEQVFIALVQDQFPSAISGILLAAVLAAVMSTADSQLLVASTSFTEDIYRLWFRREARDKELLLVSRVSVLVIAGLAFMIALDPESGVLDLVEFAWAGFGASIGPVMLFALFSKKTTLVAAIGGVVVGGVVTIVWKQLSGGIFELYEIVPGFLLSAIFIYLVSQITHTSKDVLLVHQFDQVKSNF